MIFSLQKYVEKIIPFTVRDVFVMSLILSCLVFLLLILFQPFEYRSYPLFKAFSDSLLTAFLVLVITFTNRLLLTYLNSIRPNFFKHPFIIHSTTILLDILLFIVLSFLINLFFSGFYNISYLGWLVSTIKYVLIFEVLLIPISLFIKHYFVLGSFFSEKEYTNTSNSLLVEIEKQQIDTVSLSSLLDKEQFIIFPHQIVLIKSSSNYIEVFYLYKGQVSRSLLRNTLENVNDKLSKYPFLFRCHRSYMVNIDKIEKVKGNKRGYKITVFGLSDTIPVSRSKITLFNTMYSGRD